MSNLGPSMSLGSGMGRPERHAALAFNAALATWDASASLVRWVARHWGGQAGGRQPGAAVGAAATATPRGEPLPRLYAASTTLRYRQIAARFAAWNSTAGRHAAATPDALGFLTAIAATAPGTGASSGRGDPRHLALRRTTICALRATVDRPLGLDVTAGIPLPPRPRAVLAAGPGAVAALRAAVQSPRERLLVLLACDLGLRPGEMVALRWSDVRLRQSLLYVRVRGSRLATPIPASCLAVLAACAYSHSPGDFLFPSAPCGALQPVTTRTLQNALQRLVARAGLTPGTTFTSLRKACVWTRPSKPSRGVPIQDTARPTASAQCPPGTGRHARRRLGQGSVSKTFIAPGSLSPSGPLRQEPQSAVGSAPTALPASVRRARRDGVIRRRRAGPHCRAAPPGSRVPFVPVPPTPASPVPPGGTHAGGAAER
jgi:integrase